MFDLPAEMLERETYKWCLNRQIKVVGGIWKALFCWSDVCASARQLQAEIIERHTEYRMQVTQWEKLKCRRVQTYMHQKI